MVAYLAWKKSPTLVASDWHRKCDPDGSFRPAGRSLDAMMPLGVPLIGDGCREPIPGVARGRP